MLWNSLYLSSGADDKTVRVWDYQNKTCVAMLEGKNLDLRAREKIGGERERNGRDGGGEREKG